MEKPAAPPASKSSKEPAEEPMLYFPTCNNRLSRHKCKLICERCGYYMSCADYY